MGYVPYVSFAAHRCVTASTRLCLYKKKKKKKKNGLLFLSLYRLNWHATCRKSWTVTKPLADGAGAGHGSEGDRPGSIVFIYTSLALSMGLRESLALWLVSIENGGSLDQSNYVGNTDWPLSTLRYAMSFFFSCFFFISYIIHKGKFIEKKTLIQSKNTTSKQQQELWRK
jgi:hypothetical protein